MAFSIDIFSNFEQQLKKYGITTSTQFLIVGLILVFALYRYIGYI